MLLNFLGRAPTSICHFFCLSVHPSIHPSIYSSVCWSVSLSSHLSFRWMDNIDMDNMNTISRDFFYFFQILIFRVNSGVKEQKWAKMTKNYVCCTPHPRKYIIWSWFLIHLCKMRASPDAFFFCSKFWFSGLLRR